MRLWMLVNQLRAGCHESQGEARHLKDKVKHPSKAEIESLLIDAKAL